MTDTALEAPAPTGDSTGNLLPCPFCGGEADLSKGQKGDGSPWHYVECFKCASMAEPDVWNTRQPPQPSVFDRLERICDEIKASGGDPTSLRASFSRATGGIDLEYLLSQLSPPQPTGDEYQPIKPHSSTVSKVTVRQPTGDVAKRLREVAAGLGKSILSDLLLDIAADADRSNSRSPRQDLQLGDRVQVSNTYRYKGDWSGWTGFICGVHALNGDARISYDVSDFWPPNERQGRTDGFEDGDLVRIALTGAGEEVE